MEKTASEWIIDYFGGIRPMAQKMDISHTTVQGWAKRKTIPSQRYDAVESAALHYNLGGKIIPLLNMMRQEMSSAEKMEAESGTITGYSTREEKETVSGSAGEGHFAPRPLPQYSFTPEKRINVAGAFMVSVVSISLTLGILAILFFAPDILPQREENPVADYYAEQNMAMTQQLDQYKSTIDAMADRMFELATTTRAMQEELMGLRQEADTNTEQALKMADMEQTLQSLQESNNQLRTMVNQAEQVYGGDTTGALADIRQMVDSVGDKLDTMQNDISSGEEIGYMSVPYNEPGQVRVGESAVETVVDADKVALQEEAMASLVESTGGIAAAIENGGSFSNELQILSVLMGNNPQIADGITQLKPFAETGVPQSSEIAKTLDLLSGDILSASSEYKDMSATEKAKLELNKLISIHKKDALPNGNNTADILKRAKFYLSNNQLQAAQDELEKLDPDAAQVAVPVTEKLAVTQVANAFLNQLEVALGEYIPAEYMNGIIRPWLDASRDAAKLKFKDPRSIKAPMPGYLKNGDYNLKTK